MFSVTKNGGKQKLPCLVCFTFERYIANKPKSTGYWEKQENIDTFLNEIQKKYNLTKIEDWNKLTYANIKKNGGSGLLQKYSIYKIKCLGNNEGKEIYSKSSTEKKKKPLKYWNKEENVIKYLKELKEKLNLKTFNDWNSLKYQKIKEYGGSGLLNKYKMDEIKILGFPEGKDKFTKEIEENYQNNIKPYGYWNKQENINQFLKELKEKLKLNTLDDWLHLSSNDIKENGGSRLLKIYSLNKIKIMGFPEGKDKINSTKKKFQRIKKQKDFWNNDENIIHFINQMKIDLNLSSVQDWNSLTTKQIKDYGGSSLLFLYSLFEIKCLGCPEGKIFFEENLIKKPCAFWNKDENLKKFINDIKIQFNFHSIDDWNSLSYNQIISLSGGSSLLRKYSLFQLKCFACPEGKFVFLSKKRKSNGFWDNLDNVGHFVNDLKMKFNLQNINDWKRISKAQICEFGGRSLLKKYSKDHTIRCFVNSQFPEIFSIDNKRSSQRWLFLQIQKLFPHEEIVEDYFHSDISRKTGFPVQFDVFLLDKNVAFEYHGQQHYEDIPVFAPLEMYKSRDKEKEELCKRHGIHLIIIPYWWDNRFDSLKETLEIALKCDLSS